jgi:DNA-binding XRE family transcriptional regulator
MSSRYNTLLGQQIQKIRKERRMTQEELAERIELSTKYVQFIETAHRAPSLKTVYAIAKVLKVEVRELFSF